MDGWRVLQPAQMEDNNFRGGCDNLLLMFISLRGKGTPSSSDLMNTSFEDSRVESNTSKRFTRKKESQPDSNRLRPRHDPNRTDHLKKKSFPALRPDEFFLRLAQTPTKNRAYIPLISSDRATESTVMRQRCQTQVGTPMGSGDLAGELEMRNNELMVLEDENMRLKRDLQKKEEEMVREGNRREREFLGQLQAVEGQLQAVRQQLEAKNEQLEKMSAQVKAKNEQLRSKNEELKLLRKSEQTITRQLKATKYDKLILQKQLQQLYRKKLPRQARELMSFRELSLMRQLQELKERVESCRTTREEQMQKEIHELQHEAAERQARMRNMEIHGRVLSRRAVECERELKDKTQAFGRCYAGMRDSHSDLMEQLKRARKENIKLRRLQILQGGRKRRNSPSPQSDSLSLSLSSKEDRRGREI